MTARQSAAHESVARELARLRAALEKSDKRDPIDAAVIEALASDAVQKVLLPILEDGAVLQGVVLEAAGVMPGLIQLTFETAWAPGTSHITYPPRVSAMVEISPPNVLKAVEIASRAEPAGVRFVEPAGMVPPALEEPGFPSAEDAYKFNLEARQSFADWAAASGLAARISTDTMALGLSTGTKCTSLLCFERSSDDFDRPKPKTDVLFPV
jgi:hypothetical protein